MRSFTAIATFVLFLAAVVLPTLSVPIVSDPFIHAPLRLPGNTLPSPYNPVTGKWLAIGRRELRQAKGIVNSYCSGPLSDRPAECFIQPLSSHTWVGQPIPELSNAKRIINLHCSGDPAKIPADCFDTQPTFSGPLFPSLIDSIKVKPAALKRFAGMGCYGLVGEARARCENRASAQPDSGSGNGLSSMILRELAQALV